VCVCWVCGSQAGKRGNSQDGPSGSCNPPCIAHICACVMCSSTHGFTLLDPAKPCPATPCKTAHHLLSVHAVHAGRRTVNTL
jgi:hypothetical protein